MKIDDFISACQELNVNVTEEKISVLDKYYECLINYNAHTNLTAITEKNDVYLKHFYDSLTVTKYYDFNSVGSLIDIGSGAGFPGVILAIFFPSIKVTVLDSNNKKTNFLNILKKTLSLDNLEVVNERAEDYAAKVNHQFDVCISRAVAFLDIITSLSLSLVKDSGSVILMKGNIDLEKIILDKHKSELCIKSYQIFHFKLYNTDNDRSIVIIKPDKKNFKILNYSQLIKRNRYWLKNYPKTNK